MTWFHKAEGGGMFSREDVWKLLGLVFFIAAGLSAHSDKLPEPLQAYKGWVEFTAFIGTLFNAWRMQAPQGPPK